MTQLKNNFDVEKVTEASKYIANYFEEKPVQAIILGTGLAQAIEDVNIVKSLCYSEIPFSPISTVESHKGKIHLAIINDHLTWLLSGRFHYYEGYSASESTFMIHVLAGLGVKKIFITNAVGGVNPHFSEGDLVLIEDHINFFPDHPLRGKNDESYGPRFPDMSVAYDTDLSQQLINSANELKIDLKKGIYFGWPGPSLETPAEYRMIYRMGGDVVGMSGVPEVLVARYYGIRVCMISVVSNVCFPKEKIKETTINDVIRVVSNSAIRVGMLLSKVLD